MYGSEAQFANAYGLTPFDIPNTNGEIGYEGKNPDGSGYLYVGPDGQVYNTANEGQETPGQASLGNYNTFAQSQTPAAPPPALVNALQQPAYEVAPTLQTPTMATPAANVTAAPLSTSNVDPALLAALSPTSAEALTVAGAMPMFTQQDNLLTQQLADAGLVGGPAVMAGDQLASAQGAALDPSLASEVTNSQNNILNAAQTSTAAQNAAATANQNTQEATNLANANATNAANATNVSDVNATNNANTTEYNANNAAIINALNNAYNQQLANYANVNSNTQAGSNAIATGGASAYPTPGTNTGLNTAAAGAGNTTPGASVAAPAPPAAVTPPAAPAGSEWA